MRLEGSTTVGTTPDSTEVRYMSNNADTRHLDLNGKNDIHDTACVPPGRPSGQSGPRLTNQLPRSTAGRSATVDLMLTGAKATDPWFVLLSCPVHLLATAFCNKWVPIQTLSAVWAADALNERDPDTWMQVRGRYLRQYRVLAGWVATSSNAGRVHGPTR